MYKNNDEERSVSMDSASEPVNEAVRNEPVYQESSHNDAIYSEYTAREPDYGEPAYSEPADRAPAYSEPADRAPAYNEPTDRAPAYSEPTDRAPAYNEPPEAQRAMYSPGICANQPTYPRARKSTSRRPGGTHKRNSRVGGFLRAVCLVLACSLFSGAAAYFVMDFRFRRGDFTVNNQVVLGGSVSDARQDDNLTAPISTVTPEMSAQDIYDVARTQVVGIVTEAPGLPGAQGSQSSVMSIYGSGFIISSDGYILTNFHVIELARKNDLPVSVVLSDGTSYHAQIVGFEASNDVAVLKIDAQGLNPALIGNSDNIRVGQTIYAIGNPFGDLVYTMTDGIISALDRVVSVEGKSISAFQFSAAVHRGNSGGPIYNTSGEVLGIVTAKVVRENIEGIGFAVPINDAIEIAADLIEHGYISGRPLIGITGQNVSSGHADYYGWEIGVYVRGVNPDSAADTAGIAVGDIITALNDQEVDSMDSLKFALRSYNAGDTTTITVWRNGDSVNLTITFDEDMYAGQSDLRPAPEADSPNPFEEVPE